MSTMSLAEHDYIGLSEASKMESSEKSTNNSSRKGDLNLKATELRLGLPGSESPERDSVKNNNLVTGAKRGFADTINGGSGNWVFNVNGGGCEVDLSENGAFLSPKGDTKNSVLGSKENVSVSASAQDLMEKKSQVSAENGQGAAAAAPATRAQVVGWPPIRSFRKNTMATNPPNNENVGWPPVRSFRKNAMDTNLPNNDNEVDAKSVGWPPVRSFRKNAMDTNLPNNDNEVDAKSGSSTCLYVKVSMDGAPYLRKVDLKIYTTYMDLSSALEKMFSCFTIGQYSTPGTPMREGLSESKLMDLLHGSEYVLTYEDKDGDWMLVGDVPWDMFTGSCKRMRIMKSSEAIGLAPRAMEKCRNRN